ncbi:trypsin-like serine protease [Rhodococcus sp. ABRD24]|uniref:S1C family serine protease n=1 Tax=Rhodococcus sp. ABRD24 TaxID=2507582 RepID=UPI00103F4414|nr:trypsin-like peptidase domain-containing protein [Rhodococcus sp. ABRD24]QBJ96730.1 trypsin-like serine protease [Rhodococcus sp. ABRD24]
MTANRLRRSVFSAALAVLAAAGLALVAIPLEHGTIDASPPAAVVAPAPPSAIALSPEEISNRVVPTIVTITATSGFTEMAGTGIVLSPDAVVLTNHHVIDGGSDITATSMHDKAKYAVEVLGYDSSRDLAVLRLTGAKGLPAAVLGSSNAVRVGDAVTAIGNAEGGGVPVSAPGAVTRLGVAVTTRNTTDGSRNQLSGLIEVDANVRPGDSGGPLVDALGNVIGVSSAGNAVDGHAENAPTPKSFAIPIGAAMPLVDQILAGRSSETVHIGPTPLLGVSVRDHRGPQSPGPSGAQVAAVGYRSPAEGVGLARGDVITEFDGVPIRAAADLTTRMIALHPGDAVKLRWIDGAGLERVESVVLAEGPPH